MAVTSTPIFVQTPKNASVSLTATANTNVDGTTGVYTTILTAGANGSKVERIRLVCTGTVAEKVRIFVGGKLFNEILFAAVTPSNTVTSLMTDIDCSQAGNALILSASTPIIANVNIGTSCLVHVQAFYWDF
ncbi:hypothetical protein UFOVP1349_44 [uncultured Caudovirales phage]|uniref:Uncharacterized protein n=1 Tax=uncultured Caudovirales phage TaxID=2100421 RepID=A0A6J5RT91_9CAUD|nr:hypothetical protein UFOVP925_56 [uncultured Caudovirales phage]CAB4184339.1 hypothetical protein UFOVP1097_50 [uncultured Caudovirales phage]CAB4200402.1 hypothetical protein UFOVP1349_44 [uncultured Caudovirales phage]CAB4214236.1 hypothetical protein UFOVP1456_24 [uncultured Caudovirales phage]